MFRTFRSQMQSCRLLLIPVTVLALILSPHTRVALHAAEGDLDPTFGTGGIVTTDFGNTSDAGEEVAVQPDGKIVVAGTRGQDFAVARYNADGSLDTTFGTGGLVSTDLYGNSADRAAAMALQPDGKIVLAGNTAVNLVSEGTQDFALVRYNSDGSLDTTFGTGGKVRTDFNTGQPEGAVSVAIDSVGRIVAVGATFVQFQGRDFAIARYNPDGSLDTTFDGDGRVTSLSTTNFDGAVDVAIQSDDRIVVFGFFVTTESNFALARYNTDGSLDTTFGGTGVVVTNFGGDAVNPFAVVIQPDGKVLAVGDTFANNPSSNWDFALARFNADGTPDASFGVGGQVTTDFNVVDRITDVALQADGKIVGTGLSSPGSGIAIALTRYEADGTLDVSFGVGGLVQTSINVAEDARGIAVQADGKILVTGQTQLASGNGFFDFFLVRYEGPPPPHDLTFYLHGTDIPGTAGGFTMNATAPSTQVLVAASNSPSWFSDPVVDGTFLTGSTFQVTLPCLLGVGLPKTVRLASTDSGGGNEQLLGQAAVGVQLCQSQTIAVPVTTPATVLQRRLKLTIVSPFAVSPPLILGSQTFVRATNFVGAP
jgi:uncharacterized delta-60 repeat protein